MITLRLLPAYYSVCRLDPDASLPDGLLGGPGITSITSTPDELSVVCRQEVAPRGERMESGWRVFAVAGPLDLDQTGVLSSLTQPLADGGIAVFAVSTFDTDYFLVRAASLGRAVSVLRAAGHQVLT